LKTLVALFSLAMLSACATAPRGSEAADIDPARLSEHVRVLASDPYEGRAPGSAGETRTVAYLIDQFRALGLQPGGPDGQWTQTVPMIRTQLGRPASVAVRQAGETTPLQMPDAVYLSTVRETQRARIENAPMVFVGYGVSAPERGWDDFKDVDLRGRIAVFLVNDPDFEAAAGEPVAGRFGGPTMTYYGRWTYKFEEAARRGAIGALVIHETEGAGYAWNVVQAPGGENYNIVLPAGAQQPLLLQGWIQRGAAEALFRRAGLDFETVKRQARTEAFRPIDLRATFSADIPVETQRIESHNVLARLPGRTHPDETIMYGGHWDAYGIGAPDAQGRRIRPGAADDALGIAGVIEIARAFAAGPRPERSIVFAAWTAEERGLLGSEYYAANPVWPLERTVANFTMDVLQTAGPARDVVRVGRGQSTLEGDLEAFARRQGRSVSPETHPERGLFYRADHFPFAKRGVPVLLIMGLAGGSDLVAGGREAGERWVADYTGRCYHQTCDAWSADWDLRGAAQDVALFYAMGRDLAGSRRWPDWQEGSEFRSVRARSAAMRR
jgi:Zn-dependent M28 family amino/carboxypeptidase